MNAYLENPLAKLIGFVGCCFGFFGSVAYSVQEWGWFLGLSAGTLIGIFYGFICGALAFLLWPLPCAAVVGVVYLIFKN